jgi:hypothetical protein
VLSNVNDFAGFDARQGLVDPIADVFVKAKAVPMYMDNHDSKFETRKVLLMFEALIDGQKGVASALQARHQGLVRKTAPTQAQNRQDRMLAHKKVLDSWIHAFIKNDAHRVTGARATQ